MDQHAQSDRADRQDGAFARFESIRAAEKRSTSPKGRAEATQTPEGAFCCMIAIMDGPAQAVFFVALGGTVRGRRRFETGIRLAARLGWGIRTLGFSCVEVIKRATPETECTRKAFFSLRFPANRGGAGRRVFAWTYGLSAKPAYAHPCRQNLIARGWAVTGKRRASQSAGG